MYKNINLSYIQLIVLVALALFFAPDQKIFAASNGAKLAQTTLAEGYALVEKLSGASNVRQRDQAIDALRKKTSEEVSRLPEVDRIDYAEHMANVLAEIRVGGPDANFGGIAFMFITAGPSSAEIGDGVSRLLSSDNPTIRSVVESLITPGDVELSNGDTSQALSDFNLALHDPKVRKDRLLSILFRVAPVESAQWSADHTGLPAGDRAALEPELQKAWQLHRAVNDPSADPGTKAILDDSIKKPLLDHWLNSQFWILRSLANGLLQKHQEWQTPDLKKGMQPVQVPEGVQVSSTDAQTGNK